MMRPLLIATLALPAFVLSACVGGSSPPPRHAPPRSAPPPTAAGQRPAQQTYRDTGPSRVAHGEAGSLIGRDANGLISLFGQPRINRRDGAATVMQFAGRNCMLDAYLYPPREGAAPVVAHVDTRSVSDGNDVDRQGCINALQRR
jgi:hypothetical protein